MSKIRASVAMFAGLGSARGVGERVIGVMERLVGRRQLWRIGRLAYRYARRDGPNDPHSSGEYRLHERIAARAAGRGDTLCVLDIGANTGFWAEHLLQVCRAAGVPALRLYAFEPSDDCRATLEQRLSVWTGSYAVVVYGDAVADTPGETCFDATPGVGQSKHILSEAQASAAGAASVRVHVTTVEEIFRRVGLERVDFVKSDVEGFDLAVIKGALPLLRAGRIGLFQFEYNQRWVPTRSFLRDVFELMQGLPYQVCKIVPDGIDRYHVWHQELETFFEANFLLVHDELAAGLGVREGSFDASNTYDVVRG